MEAKVNLRQRQYKEFLKMYLDVVIRKYPHLKVKSKDVSITIYSTEIRDSYKISEQVIATLKVG